MKTKYALLLLALLHAGLSSYSQTRTKEINHQNQSWFSLNSQIAVAPKWSVLGDVHVRRNHGINDASFYLLRGALAYHINKNMYVAAGYGHLWLAPTTPGWKTYSNENRIYEQFQLNQTFKKVSVLQRLRNEQRWVQKISNDKRTGQLRFTDRIRYTLSLTIPVFKNPKLPALALADELNIQFGKEVIYNTFDQNRWFIGIKQKISSRLSFDLGYMKVYQQKYSGYQYDSNNTLRLFFYYTSAWKKDKR